MKPASFVMPLPLLIVFSLVSGLIASCQYTMREERAKSTIVGTGVPCVGKELSAEGGIKLWMECGKPIVVYTTTEPQAIKRYADRHDTPFRCTLYAGKTASCPAIDTVLTPKIRGVSSVHQ